ncbi:glycoside hydrolase family 10 protein [Paenibacillus sp. GCM10023252]|uniref:glycoside hydrolase family 10 protein n=1 Tax=Paenibacillus sp. GCM10023252 TaxID=3252649 RepID=UPI0036077176
MRKAMTRVVLAGTLAAATIITPATVMPFASHVSYADASVLTVTAVNGKSAPISGVNMTRGAGMLVLYNPIWGYKTAQNAFGAEVILVETGTAGQYKVTGVNSAFTDLANSGNSEIPENGLVLSAGPGGTPDTRRFLVDNFKVGDTVKLDEPIVQSATNTAVAVDPTPQSNPAGAPFDGYRGENQLLVYTKAFGPSTKTNQYGYEITVTDGVVTAAGGANSAIPENGFVVSGHGTAAAWLSSASMIGAKVTVSGTSVTITKDAGSYVFQAEQALGEAVTSIESGLANYVNAPFDKAREDVKRAEALIEQARGLANSNLAQSVYLSKQAISAARDGYYHSLPSRTAEARGVWYRPMEKSPQEVIKTLDRMQAAGFNELYLETWFGGYTIYPSEVAAASGVEKQTPSFVGWDPLEVFTTEAKKRGIEVHAWLDGFMVGIDKTGGPVLRAHPEWSALARNQVGAGKPMPQAGNGYFWLDITNDHARKYLMDITKEMVTKYDLAGVDLDYMRFPHASSWQSSYNFSDFSRAAFQAEHGVDPYTIDATTQKELWNTWTEWLTEKENSFVASMYTEMKAISSQVIVSATPEPGAEAEKIGSWSEHVDVVIPQAYSYSTDSVRESVVQHKGELRPGNLVYSGIYPMYVHMGPYETVQQVLAAQDIDHGTTVFAFGQASPLAVRALKEGPWREAAVSPGRHPVDAIRALVGSIEKDMEQVYVPRGAVSEKSAKALGNELEQVLEELGKAGSWSEMAKIEKRLDQARADVSMSAGKKDGIQQVVADRLQKQLDYASDILLYAVTKQVK